MIMFDSIYEEKMIMHAGDALNRLRKSCVLRLFLRGGTYSQIELSKMFGISKPVVSQIVNEMKSDGLINEISSVANDKGVGRPALKLGINSGGAYVLGAWIRSNHAKICAINLEGNSIAEKVFSFGVENLPDDFVKTLLDEMVILRNEVRTHFDKIKLLGATVLMGATVDDEQNLVCAPYYKMQDYPLAEIIAKHLGVPTTIEDTPVGLALSGSWFGLTARCKRYVYLQVLPFIHFCYVRDGICDKGSNNIAGSIGANIVNIEGCKRFICDIIDQDIMGLSKRQYGQCIQASNSTDVMIDMQENPDYLRPRLIPLAEIVAVAIHNIRYCLDPEVFIIGELPECLSGEFLKMVNLSMAKFESLGCKPCRIELALQSPGYHEKALLVQVLNRLLNDIKLKKEYKKNNCLTKRKSMLIVSKESQLVPA